MKPQRRGLPTVGSRSPDLMKLMSACLFVLALCAGSRPACAIGIRISSEALERTLSKQLFTGPGGRYYLRGTQDTPCSVYAEDPKVRFEGDRVIIHVRSHARLGTTLRGSCLGVGLTTEADVSVLPEAEGETIGFRDPRIDHLSQSRELNFFLIPFLSRKLPQKLSVDAGTLLRQLLRKSLETTGYELKLDQLKIHSMQVDNGALTVDLDGTLLVH